MGQSTPPNSSILMWNTFFITLSVLIRTHTAPRSVPSEPSPLYQIQNWSAKTMPLSHVSLAEWQWNICCTHPLHNNMWHQSWQVEAAVLRKLFSHCTSWTLRQDLTSFRCLWKAVEEACYLKSLRVRFRLVCLKSDFTQKQCTGTTDLCTQQGMFASPLSAESKVKHTGQDLQCIRQFKKNFPMSKVLSSSEDPPPLPLVKHHPKIQPPSNLYKLITSCHLSVFWFSCFSHSANFLARCFDFILDFTKTQTAEILYKQSSKTTQFSTG